MMVYETLPTRMHDKEQDVTQEVYWSVFYSNFDALKEPPEQIGMAMVLVCFRGLKGRRGTTSVIYRDVHR